MTKPRTTKSDFQTLAVKRIREARILLAAGEADGAYYLGGYAVECAIKACIIKKLNNTDEWQDRNFSDQCYRHDLEVLLKLAELDALLASQPLVEDHWGTVKEWKETSRYEHGMVADDVKTFLDAIDDPSNGVLTWIMGVW